MNKLDEITNKIRLEIRTQLVGRSFEYQGRSREILRFNSYWGPGFEYVENFDLASVPAEGPITVNLKFVCWALQDIDGNSRRNAQIDGQFGPIIILFQEGKYNIDISDADFSHIQIG